MSEKRSLGGITERMRSGLVRFSAVAVFSVTIFALSVRQTIVLSSALPFIDAGSPLLRGCWIGLLCALLTQLACERGGRPASPRMKKLLPYLVSISVAIIFALIDRAGSINYSTLLSYVFYGLDASSLCIAFWLLYSPGNEDTLFGYLLKSGAFVLFILMILYVGAAACLLAFGALVGDVSETVTEIVLAFITFIIGINLMCSFIPGAHETIGVATPTSDRTARDAASIPDIPLVPKSAERISIPRAYHAIMVYVVFPILLVLLAVLYIYIGKIIITWQMPQGEMNWYGSFALLGFLVLWLGIRMYPETWVRRFIRWGWILLIPVGAVQVIGVWIRLQAYGLTPLRYLSLALLMVGFFGLVLWARRGHPRTLFLVLGVVALIVTISPFNALDVSTFDQQSRLEMALSDAGMLADGDTITAPYAMPDEELTERIISSWEYLDEAALTESQDFIGAAYGVSGLGYYRPALIMGLEDNQNILNQLKDHSAEEGWGSSFDGGWDSPDDESERSDVWYYYYRADSSSFDVQGYSRAYRIDEYQLSDDRYLQESWDDGTQVEIPLGDEIAHLTDTYGVGSASGTDYATLSSQERVYDCGNGDRLVIDSVDLFLEDGEVSRVYLTGWLLVA